MENFSFCAVQNLDSFSRTFTIHRTAGEWGGYLFNSSLLLPSASHTLRYWPGGYCRDLTSAHSWQSDSNQEPLVSERKSLTTKLRAPSFQRNIAMLHANMNNEYALAIFNEK